MDLLLCAIDARSGQTWFGPKLSYALPVAELIDLTMAGRIAFRKNSPIITDPQPTGELLADAELRHLHTIPAAYLPMTVQRWMSLRGPWHIDSYLSAATGAGIVKIVTAGDTGTKTLSVIDPEPIRQAVRRLIAVLDEPAPVLEDIAFAVLADAAAIARPHLDGWNQRGRRARLSALRRSRVDGDAAQVLRVGRKTVAELARLAPGDPRTIEQRMGLTRPGVSAAKYWNSGPI
jgi:Golgi phosphoprotein 3 (GPP34)